MLNPGEPPHQLPPAGPQITTVQWRNNFFAQVNGGALLRVPTELHANIKVALVPTPLFLGPYKINFNFFFIADGFKLYVVQDMRL